MEEVEVPVYIGLIELRGVMTSSARQEASVGFDIEEDIEGVEKMVKTGEAEDWTLKDLNFVMIAV
jgi:hypothetical protein